MTASLLDELVNEALKKFWAYAHSLTHEDECIPQLLGESLLTAVAHVIPENDSKRLHEIACAIRENDVGDLDHSLKLSTDQKLLRQFASEVIEQLAWRRDPLLALVLPNRFGYEN
jgi:hypothetical protein